MVVKGYCFKIEFQLISYLTNYGFEKKTVHRSDLSFSQKVTSYPAMERIEVCIKELSFIHKTKTQIRDLSSGGGERMHARKPLAAFKKLGCLDGT